MQVALPPTNLTALQNQAAPHQAAWARAQEFEAIMLHNMLAPMFAGLGEDDSFTGGSAEQTWRGLLVEEYANTMAQQGGIGIAKSVYRELIGIQENSQ